MKERVERFLKQCKDERVPVFVTEAFRSQARQNYLYAFGRFGKNSAKMKLTFTTKSKHKKGEAIDIAFDRADHIYEGNWPKVYRIAEENGLKSLFLETDFDRPHLYFDHDWKPTVDRRADENTLMTWGIVTTSKNLDLPPTREEMYKIVLELFKRNHKKIQALEKKPIS